MESKAAPAKKHFTFKKWIASAVLLYLLYIFCTGVFPFLRSKTVSEVFASTVSVSDFYSAAHLRFFISAAPFQLLYRIVYFITFPVFL